MLNTSSTPRDLVATNRQVIAQDLRLVARVELEPVPGKHARQVADLDLRGGPSRGGCSVGSDGFR